MERQTSAPFCVNPLTGPFFVMTVKSSIGILTERAEKTNKEAALAVLPPLLALLLGLQRPRRLGAALAGRRQALARVDLVLLLALAAAARADEAVDLAVAHRHLAPRAGRVRGPAADAHLLRVPAVVHAPAQVLAVADVLLLAAAPHLAEPHAAAAARAVAAAAEARGDRGAVAEAQRAAHHLGVLGAPPRGAHHAPLVVVERLEAAGARVAVHQPHRFGAHGGAHRPARLPARRAALRPGRARAARLAVRWRGWASRTAGPHDTGVAVQPRRAWRSWRAHRAFWTWCSLVARWTIGTILTIHAVLSRGTRRSRRTAERRDGKNFIRCVGVDFSHKSCEASDLIANE